MKEKVPSLSDTFTDSTTISIRCFFLCCVAADTLAVSLELDYSLNFLIVNHSWNDLCVTVFYCLTGLYVFMLKLFALIFKTD